jgi:hypothetical protein
MRRVGQRRGKEVSMDQETEVAVEAFGADAGDEGEIVEALDDKLMSRDIICC